jgi:HSP20 family protein
VVERDSPDQLNTRSRKDNQMNTLTRRESGWNPFKEMEDLHQRLNSLLTRNFSRLPLRNEGESEEALTISSWTPLVDITEDEKEYVLKVELPEVKKSDVKVTVENGVLTISGERKLEKEEKNRRFHRIERAYGQFVRSFTLPDDSETENVSAEFKDGVLQVRVSKSEKARPKAIDVKVG